MAEELYYEDFYVADHRCVFRAQGEEFTSYRGEDPYVLRYDGIIRDEVCNVVEVSKEFTDVVERHESKHHAVRRAVERARDFEAACRAKEWHFEALRREKERTGVEHG